MKTKSVLYVYLFKFLVLLLSFWLFSLEAFAFTGGNLDCWGAGPETNNRTYQAGSRIFVSFNGGCTVLRAFPKGAATNLEVANILGADPAQMRIVDFYNYTYMSQLPLGSYGSACVGGPCKPLAVGDQIFYAYNISGTAPNTPGKRDVLIGLGATSIDSPNYAEWIQVFIFTYNVSAVSCTLSTPSTVNLNFGTVSNTSISGQSQSTRVSVNCPSAVTAQVTLTPSQTVVDANNGMSRSTLNGLNMQAIWSDTGNPVVFSSPRTIYMNTGINDVNLKFKPQVVSGQSPSGAFQSQYTLNISYQ